MQCSEASTTSWDGYRATEAAQQRIITMAITDTADHLHITELACRHVCMQLMMETAGATNRVLSNSVYLYADAATGGCTYHTG